MGSENFAKRPAFMGGFTLAPMPANCGKYFGLSFSAWSFVYHAMYLQSMLINIYR
jgi:hypothetical protein